MRSSADESRLRDSADSQAVAWRLSHQRSLSDFQQSLHCVLTNGNSNEECQRVVGAMDRILVIDDDVEMCTMLAEYLESERLHAEVVHDGETGLKRALSGDHSVIVLDVMLPGMNGLEVLRRLRSVSNARVVLLTARGEELDRIVGLEVGADDYVPKPFSPRELLARIRAILRRPMTDPANNRVIPRLAPLILGDIEMDFATRSVSCGERKLTLTAVEFNAGCWRSEQLEVEPAKYFVLVTKREKRACPCCERGKVVTAPVPVRIIEKSLVSDRVVIDTLIRKYCDHLPLFRQSVILEREAGLEISRATMDGWVMQVGEMLRPLVEVMGRELVEGSYLQADETPVDVQMHDGRGQNHQAYLWQYGRPGGATVFDFRMGRERAGPQHFLRDFQGILQTDAYQAYDKVGGKGMVQAGCWTHARRGFAHLVKLNPGDPVASPIVAWINQLFAVDGEAREQGRSLEERHQLRQQKAPALLEKIKTAVEAARAGALPGGLLAKSCQYTLGQWPRLTCFLQYPELELSNNLAENSMRPITLGRKNWIHIGSQQAGSKVAAILSVIETCRRLKISPRDYLSAVLPGLADAPIRRLPTLTPTAWAAQHQ